MAVPSLCPRFPESVALAELPQCFYWGYAEGTRRGDGGLLMEM